MKNPFIITLKESEPIDTELLKENNLQEILDNASLNSFNLYFISFTKKIRFCLELCQLENSLLKIHFTYDHVKHYYELKIKANSIDRQKSTPKTIYLNANNKLISITSDYIRKQYNFESLDKQELVYIGQSIKIGKRIRNHEKLIQAYASIGDHQDLLINMIKPSFSYHHLKLGFFTEVYKETIKNTNLTELNYEHLVNFTERILINYFKPILNKDFVKLDLSKDKTFQSLKNKSNFDTFIFETSFIGPAYQFYTKNQKLQTNDFIINNNLEYQEYTL